ncbi:hypothetical protein [Microbulbifer variabilis]|nr:hypothetical protein [Microbulbifer variabilis]
MGIEPRKSLAKLVNRVMKKILKCDGVFVLGASERHQWMQCRIAVSDV